MQTVLRYIALILLITIALNLVFLSERFGIDSWYTIAQTVAVLVVKEMAVMAAIVGFMSICMWLIPGHPDDF